MFRNKSFALVSTSNAVPNLPRIPFRAFFTQAKPYPECRSGLFALQGLGDVNLVRPVDLPGMDCARGLNCLQSGFQKLPEPV